MVEVPSPAIAIVGRHNSGKTTLIVKLIEELVSRGLDVGSVKHHSHVGFDIDHPGKDSYRHREAGARETVISAPGQIAIMKTIDGEMECSEIVRRMPGHDIIVVEGYRKSGLPTIELMRSGNAADQAVAQAFLDGARQGAALGTDFVQLAKGIADPLSIASKMPTSETVAVVSDIPEAQEAAALYQIPCFGLQDYNRIVDFLEEHFVRPRLSVVIQAGGESRRMGQSKATVPFAGRPLICRLVERLAPVADELLITTNEPENLAFLHDLYPDLEITFVRDKHDFRGALPGLHTALENASNPYVAVVACDMVFASAALVVAESLVMAELDADVVIPVNKHGYEPFHALYRKTTCLGPVEDAIARGEKRAQAFFNDDSLKIVEFTQEKVLEAEPRGACFINANTPEELKRLEDSYLGE